MGISTIRENTLTPMRPKISMKILLRKSADTKNQNISGFSDIIRGPGLKPCINNAPRITAVTLSPGIPSVSIGMNAPPTAALFAASGAITPSTAPSPNGRCGFLTVLRAWSYASSAAISPPAPGRAPMNAPIAEALRVNGTCLIISLHSGIIPSSFCLIMGLPISSIWLIASETPNRPIMATT